MERLNNRDIIGDLVRVRSTGEFDPTNPTHRKAVAAALRQLSYCADTMALVLEVTGARSRNDHNQTYDRLPRTSPRI